MRVLLIIAALLLPGFAWAQATVNAISGYMATSGCPTGYDSCFTKYDTTGVGQPVTLSAGTNVVGQTFGQTTKVAANPTVQNASYVSGNCLGGFNAVTIARVNGGSMSIDEMKIASFGGSVPALTIYLFDANPAASTCTDKSTFTLAAADVDKLIVAPFTVTLAAPTGTTVTFGEKTSISGKAVAGGSSASGVKTIYYALVNGTTFTPATTTDIHVSIEATLN